MSERAFTLVVDGMHCGGCVRRVQGVLEKVPGLTLDDVTVGKATGSFDSEETDGDTIVQALKAAGYASALHEEPAGGAD